MPMPFGLKLKKSDEEKEEEEIEKIISTNPIEQLMTNDLGKFPFSPLWADEEETSLLKFAPIANTVLLVIVLIILYFK